MFKCDNVVLEISELSHVYIEIDGVGQLYEWEDKSWLDALKDQRIWEADGNTYEQLYKQYTREEDALMRHMLRSNRLTMEELRRMTPEYVEGWWNDLQEAIRITDEAQSSTRRPAYGETGRTVSKGEHVVHELPSCREACPLLRKDA